MSELVDTNVFIRVLTRDDPDKFEHCLSLLERAERGEVQLVAPESVIAEIVYVLSSRVYRTSRGDITTLVRPILELRGLTIEHKQSVVEALSIYGETDLDFEDCLSIAHARRLGVAAIYSYDRGFDRITTIQRREP